MATLPKNATINKLAKILECSRKTVYGHIKKAGIKAGAGSKKEYPTRQVLLAVHEHRQADNSKIPAIGAKAEKYRLECRLLEHKIKVFEGEYFPAVEVGTLLEKVVMAIRSRLLAFPTKAAPLVVDCKTLPEAKEMLDIAVREALEGLASINVAELTQEAD